MAPRIKAIVDAGIPAIGHLGLTPQSVAALGGFRLQGKGALQARKIVDDARALEEAGHQTAYVTLHVGPGTFRPVQVEELDEHDMHEEAYEVPEATVAAIEGARAEGRPVVAVGTTVVRTLEASVDEQGSPTAGVGETRLFIRPPYDFQVVDHLVTNFHLPRSTLLALVMAFAGVELTRRAYQEAIAQRYRFYSYGDAMLIRRGGR